MHEDNTQAEYMYVDCCSINTILRQVTKNVIIPAVA